MREADNIREVEQCGADWMGFIFYAPSPRNLIVRPEYLPADTKRVGVFVNADFETIAEKIKEYQLNLIQLHGNESPETCLRLKQQGIEVIKAFAIRSAKDFEQTVTYTDACDYFLFDTPCIGYGGSGKSFDWSLLQFYQGKTPFLLSGGIRTDSLGALAAFHHPAWAGIDLNSGFETTPAHKDAAALKTFIELRLPRLSATV